MILTDLDIYRTAIDAGFRPADALNLTAVALAESQGQTTAHNPVPPDDSYGLWQINMLHSGAAKRAAFGIGTNAELFDPKVNARAAHVIFGWQGMGAWSTWLGRAYVQYLPRARAAAADYAHTLQAPAITRVLRYAQGATVVHGDDVTRVQQLVGAMPDGAYGPDTAAAVRRWQAGHHLVADGVWGPVSTTAAGWRWLG